MSKRSGYAKMYMITPRVWELVKKCVDDLEAERINQLNVNRNIQPMRTRSEQILSNISSMDINPIEETLLPRNLSPIPESDEIEIFYTPNVQNIEPTYDTEMSEPRIDSSVQTELPTEQKTITANVSSQTNIPTITYPSSDQTFETIQPTNIRPIRQTQAVSYNQPSSIDYKKPKSITFKQPLSVGFKKPIPYTRKRKSDVQYMEPITVPDPFIQNYPTQDYNIQNVSQASDSFGVLPPPEYRSEEFEFNPKIHSTPISAARKSSIQKPKPSRIPLPILPLPSCTPKSTAIAKMQKRTLSTIEPQSKTAISKPQLAITQLKQKAITTRTKPALTYSPIRTRSITKGALVKKDTYICPLCGLEFTTQVNMERHMRVLHNATSKNYDKWKK
jgi:Zinc finger, C2H2 type